MTTRERILLEAEAWSTEQKLLDKDFFKNIAGTHNPKILWIGSVDSLLPVREVTNFDLGEILVYRNVASLVRADDHSFNAVLEYALQFESLELIIVCGYSHCGGIRQVVSEIDSDTTCSNWLSDLKKMYDTQRDALISLPYEERVKKLCYLNIAEQTANLARLPVMRAHLENKKAPQLLGWYFDLVTGAFEEVQETQLQAEHYPVEAG